MEPNEIGNALRQIHDTIKDVMEATGAHILSAHNAGRDNVKIIQDFGLSFEEWEYIRRTFRKAGETICHLTTEGRPLLAEDSGFVKVEGCDVTILDNSGRVKAYYAAERFNLIVKDADKVKRGDVLGLPIESELIEEEGSSPDGNLMQFRFFPKGGAIE